MNFPKIRNSKNAFKIFCNIKARFSSKNELLFERLKVFNFRTKILGYDEH
jgi:hypothetical protein